MSHLQPFHLIYEDKHFNRFLQNGIVIDSGILLEFLKLGHKKTKGITLTEEEKTLFFRLERFLSIGHKYITPHILAELSNLIGIKICRPNTADFHDCIELTIAELNKVDYHEIPIKKEEVLATEEVNKFGVADSGMILVSKKNDKMILTDDDEFCKECQLKQNLPALHLKDFESFF